MLLLSLLGCSEKEDTATPVVLNETEIECAQFNQEADCLAASSDCGAIYGWPLAQKEDGFCTDEDLYQEEKSFAGCTGMMSELTVEMQAGPADGSECWLFSSGSIPVGWIECNDRIVGECETD